MPIKLTKPCEKNSVKFKDIDAGDLFIYDDTVYMKGNETDTDGDFWCMALDSGMMCTFQLNEMLLPLFAGEKVILEVT